MRKWIGLGLLQESYTTGGLVAALVSAELEEAGVPSQLFSLLGWITLLEPVTPARLTAETGIPTTTLRDYLRLLVERGDVERRPNEADRRSYLVVTTAQGRQLSERGVPALMRAEEAVIAGLEGDGQEHLARVLELKDAVKAALAERGLPAHAARGDLRGAPERRLVP
jgi:DNA-binding MarR family transcriptional regulator